jgi:hypothetical protein
LIRSLTLAFRKKLANPKASVARHYAHYNFICLHRTTRRIVLIDEVREHAQVVFRLRTANTRRTPAS